MPLALTTRRLLMTLVLLTFAASSQRTGAATGLERLVMPGEVSQAHAKTEGDCDTCHVSFDKDAQPRACLACHEPVADDIDAHRGFHGRQTEAQCRVCHTEHKGRAASIIVFDRERFDHAHSDFALLGKHRGRDCGDCHASDAKYRDAPSVCEACHRRDDVHQGRLGKDCAQCHDSNGWQVREFDHARTGFALGGSHRTAECKACHTRPYKEQRLTQECVGCHRKDDRHRGALGDDCGQCHVDSNWKTTRFDHRSTGYPLLGRHANAECRACHADTNHFKGAPKTCIGCHRKDDRHRNTLGGACESCHRPQGWKPAPGFDHARTEFVLTGKHRTAKCSGCHADAEHFRDSSRECIGCHRKDDTHKGRNGEACGDCHGSDDWKRNRFNHDAQTKFPLHGAHRDAKCESCHTHDVHTEKLASDCASCHRKDDPHKGELGDTCTACHDESAWKPSHFDHDKIAFVLLGAHRVVTCDKCHATALYRDAKDTCNGCHARDDAHKGALGVDCQRCHNTRDWRLGEFDHTRHTAFVLDGAHLSTRCDQCHVPGDARAPKISTACASCHAGDDVHEGAFGLQCERCHVTPSFKRIKHPLMKGQQ